MKQFFQRLIEPFPCLREIPLYIADVGSTGGPDRRWEPFASIHFYWFDPSPQCVPADVKWKGTLFPIGLWSSQEQRDLYCMRNPQASSLFEMHEKMERFCNAQDHVCVGKEKVALDTLDRVLQGHVPPDFLKVDAEGADLEILKGSEGFLKSSILGVQVESAFLERHRGAPLFGEVDGYLRSLGFELVDVWIERWVRKNRFHTSLSRTQVVWGDCLYLRSPEEVSGALAEKYVALLLAYRLHDMAKEFVDRGILEKGLWEPIFKEVKRQARGRGWRLLLALGAASLYGLFPKKREMGRHYRKQVLRLFAEWLQNRAAEEGIVR